MLYTNTLILDAMIDLIEIKKNKFQTIRIIKFNNHNEKLNINLI